jgi:tetratricopeptide (TPR) repeat protein
VRAVCAFAPFLILRGFYQEAEYHLKRANEAAQALLVEYGTTGTLLYLGEIDQAQRRYDRYKQLSPLDPYAFFYDSLSVLIPLLRRDHRAAIEAGRRLSPMNQWFAPGLVPYLSALGHLGLHGEAGTIRRHLLKLNPAYTVGTFLGRAAYARDADRAHIAEGLALAGLPDG